MLGLRFARFWPRFDEHQGNSPGRQPVSMGSLDHHGSQPGILHHQPHSVRGPVRIERHIRSARLENSEQADHHLERARGAKAHEHLGANPQSDEAVSKVVGPRVQLGVCELAVFVHHRHRIGRAGHLILEQLVSAAVSWIVSPRIVPRDQHLVAFRLGEEYGSWPID